MVIFQHPSGTLVVGRDDLGTMEVHDLDKLGFTRAEHVALANTIITACRALCDARQTRGAP